MSANCATLNATLTGALPRDEQQHERSARRPGRRSSSCGVASSRPTTSGSSDSDSVCALPRMWAWMTKTSVAANADRERPPRDVEAVRVGRQVAHDRRGRAPPPSPAISATSSQMAAARSRASAQLPFTLRSSQLPGPAAARTSCGPTSGGPTSGGRSSRSRPVPTAGRGAARLLARGPPTACAGRAPRARTAARRRRRSASASASVRARSTRPAPSAETSAGRSTAPALQQRLDLVGRRGRAAPAAAGRRGRRRPRRPATCRCRGRTPSPTRAAGNSSSSVEPGTRSETTRGAGRDDVGRADRVARGEVGDGVVGRVGGVLRVGGADRDQERVGGRAGRGGRCRRPGCRRRRRRRRRGATAARRRRRAARARRSGARRRRSERLSTRMLQPVARCGCGAPSRAPSARARGW